MSSYQGSTSIQADANLVFGFVSNAENFSKFVPHVQRADVAAGGVIHISGNCPHGDFRGVGTIHVESDIKRLRWESRANLHYRGWLHVLDRGDHSEVALHIEFDPGPDIVTNKDFSHLLKDHPSTIQEDLNEALARIKAFCEPALTRA